ncbi:MAG TPA: PAS domain S-box protein [Thermomicrobiales bacterium]|nr:PAS domain S-box protein [Thermomicrobiales bacterium]
MLHKPLLAPLSRDIEPDDSLASGLPDRSDRGASDSTRNRYRALVRHGVEGVSVLRADGTALYQSASIARHLGVDVDLGPDGNLLNLVHPDDIVAVRASLQRVIDRPRARETVEYRFLLPDGSCRWIESTMSNLLRDPEVGGIVVTSRDMTDLKRRERDSRLLSEASATLGSSLDYVETLERVARMSLPDFADWCSVTLLDEDGTPVRVTVAHRDMSKQPIAEELMRAPSDSGVPLGIARVLSTGRTDFCPAVLQTEWRATLDDELGPILEALGVVSWVTSPLTLRGETIGALAYVYGDSGRRYTAEDVQVAEEIARRAAVAIDNARLHEQAHIAEQKYRSVVEQVPAAMFIEQVGHGLVYISPQAEEIFGYTAQELLSEPDRWLSMVHPDDVDAVRDKLRRADETGDQYDMESRYITRDGRTVWLRTDALLRHDEGGAPSQWQGFITDVTAHKAALADITQLASIVSSMTDAVTGADLDGRINSWNLGAERLYGFSAAEAMGVLLSEFVPVDRVQELENVRARVFAGEPSVHAETVRRRKDGSLVDVAMTISLIRDAAGEIVGTSAISHDISARKLAEAERGESERRLRAVVDYSPIGIVTLDRAGVILTANHAFQRMLGYTEDELRGNTPAHLFAWTNGLQNPAEFEELVTGKIDQYAVERLYARKDGGRVWGRISISAVRDDDGSFVQSVSMVEDITEQRRAEDALRDSEARFRSAFDDAAVGMALFGIDGRFMSANPALCEMLGHASDELIGQPGLRFSHPDDTEAISDLRDRVLRGETDSYQIETRYLHRSGATVWCAVSAAVVRDESGEPLYMVTQFQDVTERKLAGEELRRSEERFRAVYENAPIGIVILNPHGDVVSANAAFERMTGYTEAEMRAMPFDDFIPQEERAASDRRFGDLVTGQIDRYTTERRYVRKDGQILWASLAISAMRDEDGRFLHTVSMIEDVTEARDAEEALRRSEHRYRSLVQNATDVTTIIDEDGIILYESPSVEGILGHIADALVGTNSFSHIHPDDTYVVRETMRHAVADPASQALVSYRFRHADGSWRWLEASARSLVDDPAIDGIVINARDITDRRRYESSQQILADTSAAMSESLDFEVTLERIARLSVPAFADWCVVSMLDGDGALRRVAVVHHDPAKQPLADALLHRPPSDQDTSNGIPHVVKTGQTILHRQFAPDHLDRDDPGGQYPILKQLGLESSLVVPLVVRGETTGAIAFMYGDSGRRYDEQDIGLAEELARRAATAIENARLHGEVSDAESRFRSLIQHATDMISILDAGGIIRYNSPATERLLGYRPDELIGAHCSMLLHADELQTILNFLEDVVARPHETLPITYRSRRKDGTWRWIEATVTNLLDEPGIQGIVINGRDVTERRASEEVIRDSEERFRRAFDDASVGMAVVSLDRLLTRVNPALCRMLGYEASELVGRRGGDISHPDDAHLIPQHVERVLEGRQQTVTIEKRYLHKSGATIWCVLSSSAVRDQNGSVLYFLSQFQDITERKELELQLSHLALHDSLTGLPNRTLLMDRLDRATSTARRHGGIVAVLFVDMDNFKLINDSLGHAVGDEALVGIARRLQSCVRDEDTIARFGGDEFIIMLGRIGHAARAIEVADRVLEAFRQPLRIHDRDMIMSPSIGIALSEGGLHDRDELLRHADIAMYRAKSGGKSSYNLFGTAMHDEALQRLELEHDLRRALDRDEFRLDFQPVISIPTGEVIGLEALVRWAHPERGIVEPDDFIPVAEETGLIVPIGEWVLGEACRQAAGWQATGGNSSGLRVGVNLSARQFRQPALVQQVEAALKGSNLAPELLVLELTESILMEHAGEAVDRLRELTALGVRIAIDDFGTGYSSLAYLRRFPVGILKIDRSFVSGIGQDTESAAIVSATVGLAHTLGMSVVAEGIETIEQLTVLRNLGCDSGQGYFFSRPIPASEIAAYLRVAG